MSFEPSLVRYIKTLANNVEYNVGVHKPWNTTKQAGGDMSSKSTTQNFINVVLEENINRKRSPQDQ